VHKPSIDLRISVLSENSNNTDYPRSIVIREDCCEKVHHNNLLTDNSDNDIID
jgi:hypothetical protein